MSFTPCREPQFRFDFLFPCLKCSFCRESARRANKKCAEMYRHVACAPGDCIPIDPQFYLMPCCPQVFFVFTEHGTKKISWKPSSERSQENECYKRLIYKQFVQISGLCGPQFLSYLPKHFTHLCRALYGNAILVDRNCPPIWPPEINKNIWSSLFL